MVNENNAAAMGGATCPAHPLLRRIGELMIACAAMTKLEDLAADPEWLRLPAKRREQALKRHKALLEYKNGDPTVERATKCAADAGVSVRSFYGYLPEWDLVAGPNVWALIPYSRALYHGRARLDEKTETTLNDLIVKVIGDGVRGTVKIVGEVKGRWPSDGPPMPASSTIRHHVDARGGFDIVEKGSISLNTGSHTQEAGDSATRYGEVLIIDHTAVSLFLDNRTTPRRATLTLAIDLHTAAIAGFGISDGPPNTTLVTAVLDNVEARHAGNSGEPIKPRLLFAGTNDNDWRELIRAISRRGLEANVRWGTKLHHGGPIRRMIGTRLSGLELHARKPHARSSLSDQFAPTKHALVTPFEAEIIIDDAVRRFNQERLSGQATAPIFTGQRASVI